MVVFRQHDDLKETMAQRGSQGGPFWAAIDDEDDGAAEQARVAAVATVEGGGFGMVMVREKKN